MARKRVLITGAAGYLSRQLLPVFRERYDLVLLDRRKPQDIDGIIYNMFHPKGTRNHSKVNMPEGTLFQDGGRLTAVVEAQRVEVDETKRIGLIHDIQRYASENMIYVPAVTTGNFSTFTMAWPWLHNTRVYRSVTYAQASEAWAHYWVDEAKKKEMGA